MYAHTHTDTLILKFSLQKPLIKRIKVERCNKLRICSKKGAISPLLTSEGFFVILSFSIVYYFNYLILTTMIYHLFLVFTCLSVAFSLNLTIPFAFPLFKQCDEKWAEVILL